MHFSGRKRTLLLIWTQPLQISKVRRKAMTKTAKGPVDGRWFRLIILLGLFGRLYQLSFIEGATRKHSWHSWWRDDGRRSPSTLIVRAASEAVPEGEDFEELLKFMEKANLGDFQSKVLDWCQELGWTVSHFVFFVMRLRGHGLDFGLVSAASVRWKNVRQLFWMMMMMMMSTTARSCDVKMNSHMHIQPSVHPSIHPSIPYMHMHRHFNCLSNYPIANYTIYIYTY